MLSPSNFQQADRPAIQVDDVHAAFAKIVNFFRPAVVTSNLGVSVKAVVSATAEIASTAQVHPERYDWRQCRNQQRHSIVRCRRSR